MGYKAMQFLYKDLTKNSLGNAVDIMWANILPLYFKLDLGYGIEAQLRMREGKKQKIPGFTIRTVNQIHGKPKRVCLIGDKRVSFEGSSRAWKKAVEQLTNYMMVARAVDSNETMYGIVTIGRYSRFYELLPGEDELPDFSDYGGNPLHFKNDEMQIDAILRELVELTSCKKDEGDNESEDCENEDEDGVGGYGDEDYRDEDCQVYRFY